METKFRSKSRWKKAKIFAAVVEPELLFYASDVSCVTDVIVSKFFALASDVYFSSL